MKSQPDRKAVVYCRVSTRKQEDEGTSLGSQEAACIAHAETLGYTVDDVVREVWSGGELWDRPKLTELRQRLKTDQINALVVHATDRLSRNATHLAILVEECDRHNVELLFVTEPLENTAEGALIRYVKGYAAQIEREKIRERNMRGKHARVKGGSVQTWGYASYGYRIDKEHRVRVVYEPEAMIVRRMYRWIGDEGLSLSEVVRRLNDAGVPPPSTDKVARDGAERQPRWGVSQVSRLIHRTDYKGEAWALTTEADKAGKRVARARDQWVRLPDTAVPALV
jgi:site-specific DNA recombinase